MIIVEITQYNQKTRHSFWGWREAMEFTDSLDTNRVSVRVYHD